MSAPQHIVCFTDFSIGGSRATGCDGRLLQVIFQNLFVGPVRVLQEGDVMGATALQGPHLVGCHSHEV